MRSSPLSDAAITASIRAARREHSAFSRLDRAGLSRFSRRDRPHRRLCAARSLLRGAAALLPAAGRAPDGRYRLFLAACRRPHGNLPRHGAGAADLYRVQSLRRRECDRQRRRAVGNARTGAGHGGADGRRPDRRRDRRRDRYDAGARSDRCAADIIDHPLSLSRRTAPHRRPRHAAGPGLHRRRHRRLRRLPGVDLQAGLQPRELHPALGRFPADPGRRRRPRQGGGVRLHRHADGLLQRLSLTRRCAGRRRRDDLCRGLRLDPHPGLRLRPHRGVLRAMSDMRNPVPKIMVRGLRKSFGPKRVLDGLDLDVAAGESMVVIGGSGTGKSVMLKCILGLIEPDGGSIKIDGQEVTNLSATEREHMMRKFGMLFQGGALFDSLPVWENVAFGLIMGHGMRRAEAKNVALQKLAAVGLGADVAELMPAELSGGMQKRVALARAIAAEPEIIFFDEPTTGLDPIMADVINELIVKCVKELGATAISITHDMVSTRKIADRVAMIYDGKIIWNGPKSQIDNSGNPYVDQFIHGRATGPIKMQVRAY